MKREQIEARHTKGIGTPGGFRRRNPTWPLYRIAMRQGGRAVDADEARKLFADRWWAPRAVYAGAARGMHCYERPPESERP